MFRKIFNNTYFAEHLQTWKLLVWKYLSYGIFGNYLRGEKMFSLVFTKQVEKVRISQ